MNFDLTPLQHFSLLSNMIQELYRLKFTYLRTEADKTDFCRQHCFHPVQKEFTVTELEKMIRDAAAGVIIHSADYFRIHMMLFVIEDIPIVMGPFCPLLFSQKDAHILLSGKGLQQIAPMDFLSYTSTYPFLSEKNARKIVHSIFHSIYPADDDRRIVPLFPKAILAEETEMDQSEARINYTLLLEKRYSYEQKFRKDIMAGNQRAALLNLANMEQDVSYLKRIGSTLENEKIGAAITRTTTRLAAMDGGLPGIVADQISSQNTKDTRLAKTVDEILQAKKRMICSFCTAIRDMKTNQYSGLVQSVLYEMEHHFQEDISLDALANELAVSKNYLIKRFKTEVGATPVQYLTNFRLERAVMLLAEHTLSVQDIANAVGIPDSNYFTKLFKKAYDVTPLQYRKGRIV